MESLSILKKRSSVIPFCLKTWLNTFLSNWLKAFLKELVFFNLSVRELSEGLNFILSAEELRVFSTKRFVKIWISIPESLASSLETNLSNSLDILLISLL